MRMMHTQMFCVIGIGIPQRVHSLPFQLIPWPATLLAAREAQAEQSLTEEQETSIENSDKAPRITLCASMRA